ncbi:CGNR zinc finger domain-containing protein [Streptomyces exfoliatus]|uniref:CGNR zinc finger domain-containing protein n=1 Tax=Streptomyces exfoliatus TaxID=1905 RepID=UPI003C2BCF97
MVIPASSADASTVDPARANPVFITPGSGPERRYCSRRCATRERVAAHRRSQAAGPR